MVSTLSSPVVAEIAAFTDCFKMDAIVLAESLNQAQRFA